MSVDTICERAMTTVPMVLAVGVVDIGTGILLSVRTVDSYPHVLLGLMGVATRELFEGDAARKSELAVNSLSQDESYDPLYKEVIVHSRSMIHVYIRLRSSPNVAVTVVASIGANLAAVINRMRDIAANEAI